MPGPSLRERIELAVLADLAALSYLRTREPYEGQLAGGGEDAEEVFRRQVRSQAPGVLVATGLGTSSAESMMRRRYTKEIELRVYVLAKSYRSRTATKHGERLGGGDQPGVFTMLEEITDRLAGWNCDLEGVSALMLRSEQPLLQEPDMAVWLLQFVTEVDVHAPDRAELAAPDLTALAARVNLSEAEGVIASGTGDSLSKAGSTVTLTDAGMAAAAGWVGLRLRIEGAVAPSNNGDFDITAVPSGIQLQFVNPAATAEAFTGTWKVMAPSAALLEVTP